MWRLNIGELCDHYPRIDRFAALQELASFRSILHTQEYKDNNSNYLLKQLSSNETLSAIYPVLSKFAQTALTLPVSNADAEEALAV